MSTPDDMLTAEADPLVRFRAVYGLAQAAYPRDHNVMTLATVSAEGRPSARIVLLKTADARGFVFYTNLESRKGRELGQNRHAALCFYWPSLEQQVRVEGPTQQVSDTEADAYFASRPRGSQVGAWASLQSESLHSREELDARAAAIERQYQGKPIPRPPHWSGFLLTPERVEFWMAGLNRLHNRWLYEGSPAQGWTVRRLFP